jgi:hypothetical protein
MIPPKEKADKLINKYFKNSDLLYHDLNWIQAKECALIAVDEILKSNPTVIDCNKTELNYKYWSEVKQEIEKL